MVDTYGPHARLFPGATSAADLLNVVMPLEMSAIQ